MILLKRNVILCLIFILLPFNLLFPQNEELNFSHLDVNDGLSQNQVFCIYPDTKGLLWFGTQEGLNMYDGYTFRIFRHQPGNKNSIPDYAVNTICETDTGIFWIGTREGMSRFDHKQEKFTHYVHNPDSPNSLVDNNVWLIQKDSESKLWIATKDGLSRFDPRTETFSNYKFSPADTNSISNNFVFAIIEDDSKNIWIGGRGGVDRYDLKKKKFYNYKLNTDNPASILLNGVTSLYFEDNVLWVGAYSGLYSLQTAAIDKADVFFTKHITDLNPAVRSISGSNDGSLWLGTMGEGLLRYNPASGNTSQFRKSVKPGSISDDYIASVYEGKDGVLWVGTSTSGINKFNLFSERFRTINFPETFPWKQPEVSAVIEDHNSNLWIGTSTGEIVRVNSHLSSSPVFKYFGPKEGPENYMRPVEIRTLTEDKTGNIWAGTFGSGIYIINPESGNIRRVKYESGSKNSISSDFIHSIRVSEDGSIWIGTGSGGLDKFNPKDNSFTNFRNQPDDDKTLSSNEITAVCEDNNGYIWAGTSIGGLNRYNPDTHKFDHFKHRTDDINSLSSNRVICLYLDRRSNLWIGTFGGGLNKWEPESNSFVHYTTDHGLPSNIINCILENSAGSLWISTDKGLSEFNPSKNEFRNYDVKDGLKSNIFLQNSGWVNRQNGLIYFGNSKGLNFFKPDELQNNTVSDLVFTDFKIFNKSVKPADGPSPNPNILYADKVTLTYDQNFITFEFAALDYNNPEKNKYAYKMEGFNKDWIYSGNQRYATFTNLDPGEYVFRVKAANSSGIWNEDGIAMRVILLPPWWQTWWAYLIYSAALLSILLFVRQFELKRVRLRNELELKHTEAKKLQEIDKMKSQFFANISHEFRTPLTLVLGLVDKLSSSAENAAKKDFGIIRKNAYRLLQLINQLLELSRLEAGNVELKVSRYNINLFLRRILSSFVSLAESKNLLLYFNDKPLNELPEQKEVLLYFDPDKFETVFYNLIGNAVKFSPEGERIEIEVTPHIHNIEIRITNTGIGIKQENLQFIFNRFYQADEISSSQGYEGTGIGLALVKELIELHDGEINVMSIEDKEVTFIIKMPVGRAHYDPKFIREDEPYPAEKPVNSAEAYDIISEEPAIGTDHIVSANTDSRIILVVEDNTDLRNYLVEQLEDIYTVVEAENGGKGLQIADEIIPDLIISDIMMPVMDGYEMCRKIRNNFKTSHIPIIMLTAKAGKDDKLEGLETGADDYLLKPFDRKELLIRVRNLIKLRDQMKEKCRTEMLFKPRDITVPSTEKIFIEKLTGLIEQNMSNEKFSVDKLSSEMGLSRSQLHRKLKAITDQSTTEFIRNFRLQRAANLIKQGSGNMAEIAYSVGFSSQAYFTKSFTEFFGLPPGEYRRQIQQDKPV